MKFSEFNHKSIFENRKVDPLALQDRVAQIYGKKKSYGQFWDTEPGKHIPLKPYNANTAGALENQLYKLFSLLGTNSRDPDERARGNKQSNSYSQFTLSISKI